MLTIKFYKYITLFGAVIFLFSSYSNANDWQFDLLASWNYANIEGFSQTPMGGDYNTTSTKRPTFEEAGIDNDDFYKIGIGGNYKDWGTNLSYRKITPAGTDSLTSNLLSHGQFIPQGSGFTKNVRYNWFTVEFYKILDLRPDCLSLTPFLSIDHIKFRYQYNAPPRGSIRGYSFTGIGIGAYLDYYINSRFTFELMGSNTIPGGNLTRSELKGTIYYIATPSNPLQFKPFVSIGLLRMNNEDKQNIPNHIRYFAKPYGELGIMLSFYNY